MQLVGSLCKRHAVVLKGLRPLVNERFQVLFHSPVRGASHLSLTVLVHYRSSGHPRTHPVTCTGLSPSADRLSRRFQFLVNSLWMVLQPRPRLNVTGLGSSHFDRHYFGNRYFFLFLRVLRCFSSPRSLRRKSVTGLQPAGLPHSDISGSVPVCRSPELFAAYHVLHRLRKPRHPPFALVLFL